MGFEMDKSFLIDFKKSFSIISPLWSTMDPRMTRSSPLFIYMIHSEKLAYEGQNLPFGPFYYVE